VANRRESGGKDTWTDVCLNAGLVDVCGAKVCLIVCNLDTKDTI
jgi:hypothetical protein